MNQPIQFIPLLQPRVWGGQRLVGRVGDPPSGPVGESWEVVDRPEAQSVVRAGPLAGRTLRELFAADRDALCGDAVDPASPDVFPLILKLLDAREDLSVQVHPDDAYAGRRRAGELGKTEAWYVLDADDGAGIYRGLADGVGRDAFAVGLAAGTVAPLLRRFPARAGDVFHLPAGTVHALGAGVRIAEIQQNSDTTYRVFDWNRVGLDGHPRALHLDDALAVTDFAAAAGPAAAVDASLPAAPPAVGCARVRLVRDAKFGMERFSAFRGAPVALPTGGGFALWLCVSGTARVAAGGAEAALAAWDHALVPAAAGTYTVAASPDAVLLLFYRPVRATGRPPPCPTP